MDIETEKKIIMLETQIEILKEEKNTFQNLIEKSAWELHEKDRLFKDLQKVVHDYKVKCEQLQVQLDGYSESPELPHGFGGD